MKEYNVLMPLLRQTDIDFTKKHGCGIDFEVWDEALETAVIHYNEMHDTSFCPNEAKHLYIESQGEV